ncbi:hypothetical protein PHMEG_00021645 [Phytophthora megakarya]|uniref:Uncharacterized protein n=1 Tax=Phytophthora megakarya TaxID=4795 RepID=A0A225VL39_9STRA|nr:hypothetical protein PHMEG_00021645 [Phytophthora megakarya]
MSLAIYERKHWVAPEAAKRYFPGSADWCAEAALVEKPEPCRVDWLTARSSTRTIQCTFRSMFTCRSSFLSARLSKFSVHASSLAPEDIDSSWDRAFRGADEDEEIEEVEIGEGDSSCPALPGSPVPSDADSVATTGLD